MYDNNKDREIKNLSENGGVGTGGNGEMKGWTGNKYSSKNFSTKQNKVKQERQALENRSLLCLSPQAALHHFTVLLSNALFE